MCPVFWTRGVYLTFRPECNIKQFADDTNVFFTGKSVTKVYFIAK